MGFLSDLYSEKILKDKQSILCNDEDYSCLSLNVTADLYEGVVNFLPVEKIEVVLIVLPKK